MGCSLVQFRRSSVKISRLPPGDAVHVRIQKALPPLLPIRRRREDVEVSENADMEADMEWL